MILVGSGPLIGGVILAARLIRDWSAQRRVGDAQAREARARGRIAEAEADRAGIAVEVARWLADEARAGRAGLPQGELIRVITPRHARAISHLAEQEVTLSLAEDRSVG